LSYFEELKKKEQQQNRTYSEPLPLYRRTSGKINACKKKKLNIKISGSFIEIHSVV